MFYDGSDVRGRDLVYTLDCRAEELIILFNWVVTV